MVDTFAILGCNDIVVVVENSSILGELLNDHRWQRWFFTVINSSW
jgi:hypothetical protein